MKLSVSTETQGGLTWEYWKTRVRLVEDLNFAGLYMSDHFVLRSAPDLPSLDPIVALTYAADRTERIQLGTLVSPISFRDPVHLARQFAALDDLSDGRIILGIGAGHIEREHLMFGYELGDIKTRIDRFEEGAEVITRLLNNDTPTTFDGKFFQLQEALLLPRPQRSGGPRILIGANHTRRMLPLVAKYADIWNTWIASPEVFQQNSTLLDSLLHKEGRQPEEMQRTVMTRLFWQNPAIDIEPSLHIVRRYIPELEKAPIDDIIKHLDNGSNLAGPTDKIVKQLKAYEDVGVDEVIINFWDYEHNEQYLRLLAEEILPHFV